MIRNKIEQIWFDHVKALFTKQFVFTFGLDKTISDFDNSYVRFLSEKILEAGRGESERSLLIDRQFWDRPVSRPSNFGANPFWLLNFMALESIAENLKICSFVIIW